MDAGTLIIGAGAAGLGAARELHDAGERVVVLEARDRVGGRAWTSYDLAPHPVELGAEFVHGENVSTWKYLEQYGLHTNDQLTMINVHGWNNGPTFGRPRLPAVDGDACGAEHARSRARRGGGSLADRGGASVGDAAQELSPTDDDWASGRATRGSISRRPGGRRRGGVRRADVSRRRAAADVPDHRGILGADVAAGGRDRCPAFVAGAQDRVVA